MRNSSPFFVYLQLLFCPQETSVSRSLHRDQYDIPFCAIDEPDQSQLLPSKLDLSPMNNLNTPPEHLVDAVRNLEPFLPTGCELLGQEDLKIISSYPIAAGGFADVWVGERNDGTAIAIKSYRRYSSSTCLFIYSRLYKEALTCSLLNDDKSFVPFIGIYSTQDHPFALVFKFMNHLDLRSHLRNNWDIGRLELLLEIARGLRDMHSHGIIHGNLVITNVLVDGDGHVRIAGLGMAFIRSTAPTTDTDQPPHSTALEPINLPRLESSNTGATMTRDVYEFAVLAWEVFAGQSPFSSQGVVAGVHSMLSGRIPYRPDHRELSDRLWKTMKGCWKADPAQRKTMSEVAAIIEAEVTSSKRS